MFFKRTRLTLCYTLLVAAFLMGCQPIQPPATAAETPTAPSAQATASPAPDTSTAAADGRYGDPAGLFTVPIPSNWTIEEFDNYALLTSPDGIEVYVLAVEAENAEAGLETAWSIADPAFDLPQVQVLENPAQEAERSISVIYRTPSDQFVVAEARQFEGTTYVTLVRGDLEAVQRRSAQLQIISSGLDILAAQEVDLTGVEPNPITPEVLDQLEIFIISSMFRFAIPGAAVAIVQGDDIVYSDGFGLQSLDGGEPITAETRMMIGSTSKTLTTFFMAQLVDRGIMDWDTPVVDIIPTFALASPDITQQITVQDLVCACTGVPRRDMEILFNYETLTAESVIESLATFETFTDFGEAFQYSNQMVATGGYAAAAAAGGDYGNLYDAYAADIDENILAPIGMARTTLDFATVLEGDNYARPHNRGLTTSYHPVPLDWERFVTPLAPAGAYWSSVEDMGRYLITQLNNGVTPDGERIVSAEALLHTREPQIAIDADTSYALGWIVGDYHGLRTVSHGGNTIGFTSELTFLPELDLGISVITNGGTTNPFNQAVTARLLELLFDDVPKEAADNAAAIFDQLEAARERDTRNMGESVDPAAVQAFLGRYANDALGTIDLRFEEDTFVMDVGEFVAELRPVMPADDEEAAAPSDGAAENGSRFVLYNSPLAGLGLTLRQTDDGTPQVIVGEGVVEYTFTPVPAE